MSGFGVKAWTSIDPITSLESDVLSEAKKKLAVGAIKISSVQVALPPVSTARAWSVKLLCSVRRGEVN